MSFTWLRQTNTYEHDNSAEENQEESPLGSPYYAYDTDYKFVASDTFDIFVPPDDPQTPRQSTVTFRTETTRLDSSGNKTGLTGFSELRYTFYKDEEGAVEREVREERDGQCEYDPQTQECTEIWADEWEKTVYAGNEEHDYRIPEDSDVVTDLLYRFFVISKDEQDTIQTYRSPGSYRSELFYYENSTLNGNFPQPIGDYEVRGVRIGQIRTDCPVDPQEEQPSSHFDVFVQPAPSQSPFANWVPSALELELEIKDATGEIVHAETMLVSIDNDPPNSDGKISTVDFTFDGRDNSGECLQEDADVDLSLLAEVPGPGNTIALGGGSIPIYCRKCRCDEQRGELVETHTVSTGAAGPLGALSFLYNSFDACRGPGSMGYGWSSFGSARITEPNTGEVLYRSESGIISRWLDDGNGNYVATREYNYTELTVGPSGYTLTFRDQSVREFNSAGRLVSEKDRNNNTVTYTYTGNQLDSMSDNRGHSLHFSYVGSADGQPTQIRANDPVSGRLTTLAYYDSQSYPDYPNRLKQITDPAGRVTQFEYDANARLSKKTLKRSTTALDLVTEYTHSPTSGRLISQIHNGNIETTHFRSEETALITTTPLINGEPGPECRNQYFELDDLGRVLRHVLNYVEELGQI